MKTQQLVDNLLNNKQHLMKSPMNLLTNFFGKFFTKAATITLVAIGSYMSFVFVIKDTKIADKYFNPFFNTNKLSIQEIVKLQEYVFSNNQRIREDKPYVTSTFTVMYYNDKGNFSSLNDDKAKVGLLSWFTNASFTNLPGLQEYYSMNEFRWKTMLTDKPLECIGNKIAPVNQARLKQILNNPTVGNRGVLCPIVDSNKVPIGATIVYYNAPETNVLQVQTDLLTTVKTYTALNEQYIKELQKSFLD